MIRDNSVDIAKGIGIILVVWGHTFGACPFLSEILLFHMPLFFLLSGCFISSDESLKLYAYKKIRTLLIPFVIFYSLSFFIKLILFTLRGESVFYLLKDIHFYSLSNIDYPLWFIVCLFILSILYFSIIRCIKNIFIQNVLLITLTGIGYIFAKNMIILPAYLSQVLIVLPFIHTGRIYNIYKKRLASYKLLILILAILFFFIGYYFNVRTNIGDLFIDKNPLLFYLPAFGGSFLVLLIAETLTRYRASYFLSQLGIYSLFIFSIHANMGFLSGIIEKIVHVIYYVCEYPIYGSYGAIVLGGIFKVIISVPLCYLCGNILKKYFPYLWNYSKEDNLYKKFRLENTYEK